MMPISRLVLLNRDPDVVRQESDKRKSLGTEIAARLIEKGRPMSLVRLLGFTTLGCGCVVGKYREVARSREVSYIEEKGRTCGNHGHRRNHPIAPDRFAPAPAGGLVSEAS
jgi:hypothetical protein